MMNKELTERIAKSALIGLAVGDALGVPVEFLSREEVRLINLNDMIGCDTPVPFESRWGGMIPAGAWSDDTSMTIATMASFIRQGGQIDYDDIMRQFLNWWENGAYCSIEFPFGLGGTVSKALHFYKTGIPATECGPNGERDNGNGALMRILPFSLYCIFKGKKVEQSIEIIKSASAITHGHPISQLGCLIFTAFLKELLSSRSVKNAWNTARTVDYSRYFDGNTLDAYKALLSEGFYKAEDTCIGETGYVVDCLMVAVYSMLHGTCYEDTVLSAINFGYDTDTDAAVTGALAGAFYGMDSIPDRWLRAIKKKETMETYANDFAQCLVE